MLEHLGWSDALQADFSIHGARGLSPARVVLQQRGRFGLAAADGEYTAEISGRFAFDAADGDHPVAGDWVAAALRPAEGAATIHAVLPRRTAFVRKAAHERRAQVVAANVDVAILVASLNADLNPRRLERYLATAWESGATPAIALTKADLAPDRDAIVAVVQAVALGAPVVPVSAFTGEGLDAVRDLLPAGRTGVLLGSSGVGKSSLVNALAGEAHMSTQANSGHLDKGRHTTTHRELIRLPHGGLILDTPGMRELGLWEADSGMSTAFADVEALAETCRFRDCSHGREPGCAVREALADGRLDAGRWESYGKLKRELAYEALKAEEDPRLRTEAKRVWIQRSKAHRARDKARERERW